MEDPTLTEAGAELPLIEVRALELDKLKKVAAIDQWIDLLLGWGWMGLVVVTFTESFISPLMPDLILVPLCLADPPNAIHYAALATATSVAGGFIGYGIGMWLGPGVLSRFPAARSAMEKVKGYSRLQVAWAIFLAVMSPLPYKVISITAGALRINFPMFILISFAGRAKRFMIEGVLIYYFGSAATQLIREYSLATTAVVIAASLIWGVVWWWRRAKKQRLDRVLGAEENRD